jgi:hypothetical protein
VVNFDGFARERIQFALKYVFTSMLLKKLARHIARMGREIQRILVGKTKGKRPIGRPRC